MRRGGKVWYGLMLVAALLLSAVAVPAGADVEIRELSNVFDKFTVGAELNLFYRYDHHPYYGAEITPEAGSSTSWGETYNRLRFSAEKNLGWTTLTGVFSPYFAGTFGHDMYATDTNNETDVGIDQVYLKFGKIGNGPFDLTVGMQEIKLEKAFVIGDGDNQDVAYWAYFKDAFPMAIRLDGDFGAFKTNLFYARVGTDDHNWANVPEDDMNVGGLNLHWDFAEKMYLYGGVYRKDEKRNETPTDNDTWSFDIGADVAPIEGLQLEAEFVYQIGDVKVKDTGENLDRRAYAGFGSATYTFPVQFSPFVRASYFHYSGDGDDSDRKVRTYDPMFPAFGGWNRWTIGQLVGECQLPWFNKQVWVAEAGFSPIEPMTLTLMYMQHKLHKNNYLGNAVGSKRWADEINLIGEYMISDNLMLCAGLGYIDPKAAAEEVLGNDKDAFFGFMWLNFSF